jgi:hypothetical protein
MDCWSSAVAGVKPLADRQGGRGIGVQGAMIG